MYRIFGPKGGVIVRRATAARVKAILAGLRKRFGHVKVVLLAPKPQPFIMYDSTTVSAIPRTAVAVAGYVGGEWMTFPQLEQLFPNAKRLSIAISADEDAMCLDVENGDATNAQAVGWVRRQQRRGVVRPYVYTSLANAAALLATLRRAGIRRQDVRLITAHYTYRPHRCTPLCRFGFWARADATQYTDRALGRNLDASLCVHDLL